MRGDTTIAALRLRLIDVARGTRIAPRMAPCGRSQWLSRAELESAQMARLGELLAYIQDHVPYYAALAAGGSRFAPGDDSLAFLGRLPVLDKADIRRAPADFRSSEPGLRSYARHTGGSTGAPFEYHTDVPGLSGQWAAVFRAWAWGGYRFGERMVTVGGTSVVGAGALGLKQRAYNLLRGNHPLAAGALDETDLSAMLSAIERVKPALLYGYPSVLYLLARQAESSGRRNLRPRAVVTTSEMLFPGQRAAIESAFSAPVFDQYGCNEVNLVSAECEAHEGWHYAMESTLVEILDEHGRPVPPGASGRIVGTALDNRAMPFVRYDTGDLGSLDTEPCRCGRGLVRIRSLQGRSRDLVRTPDGRYVHGVAFNDLMLEYPAVDRYQAVQLDEQRLRLVLAGREDEVQAISAEIGRRLQELTGLVIEPDVNGPFEITAGQKARVIVSRLAEPGGS